MSTHCARSAENTAISPGASAQGVHSDPFLLWHPIPCSQRTWGTGLVETPPSIKKCPSLTSKEEWTRKAQKLQPRWGKPGTITKHDTEAPTESLKANIFRIHFSISCHLSTNYLWPGSCLPRHFKTLQTDARREIFRGNSHTTASQGTVETGTLWKSSPDQFMDTSPKQVPSPWSALPVLSPCLEQGGPWQRLLCTVCRALGGVRAAQAEESSSCRVSDHLSITTPSQHTGRNAETSTVPLDTHLFFRVNWPELLCKLLALNVQSRAVFSGCALIPK